jgi:hypothetical protein
LYVVRTLLRDATNLKSVKRKHAKRLKTKEEDVEDELANQFNATMKISTKRRRVDDV